jgi:hypothetical protein
MTTISIDKAAQEFTTSIQEFVEKYKAKHEMFPELYPLEMPSDNIGLWAEFMIDYHLTGNV